ncbi:hypothetical protein ACFWBV_23765 [Streptomyces sp. NPDC060030]|uniref:hypothetical protein n=1 Tax=Streptomyces sp. NPDC060030 TaxID=3347042 RepID=UPI00369194BD
MAGRGIEVTATEPAREQVLGQIMRVLPEAVGVTADVTVHLARRVHERPRPGR